RTPFTQIDQEKTREARKRARSRAHAVFVHDPEVLDQRFAELWHNVEILLGAESLSKVDAAIWKPFEKPPGDDSNPSPEQQFTLFKEQLSRENAKEVFQVALDDALKRLRQTGLLNALPPDHEANYQFIAVRPRLSTDIRDVAIEEVLIEPVMKRLQADFRAKMLTQELADAAHRWLRDRLPSTLTLDVEATRDAQDKAEKEVQPILRKYASEATSDNVLALANEPLDEESIQLLELEYESFLSQRTWISNINRSLAVIGLYAALAALCGCYVYSRDRSILHSMRSLVTLLGLIVTSVGIAILLADTVRGWQAELMPILIFGMTAAIAYRQELAFLLSTAVAIIFIVAVGQTLNDILILMAATAGAILVLGRIRSRSKLLIVGFVAAIVVFFTSLGVNTLAGLPIYPTVLVQSARLALWAVIAGSLMTCLLPFVEWIFGVQTDISLIELGDPAHPLLQELIRRAPGTYNHSITIASLAENAAEAIGARGLLVRVGAYFHDIGKMLKPGYFIENQSQGDNRHESLVPAMSTLVIIAHVKDGADLARQHRLPEAVINFIQQHHGTTLVEFFYRQASQQRINEGGEEIDESTFRYPGPKPQTKEVAVLMIADAVEGASRVLAEPTPSRIESLVHDITMKRLEDGQLNECGITLSEIHRVEESLAKSLIAVYHGRVKYPEPETA
ncbi:MAG: HDIG domain-containing protein, partial [Pirellulales bacterium]|nr:HDIG domain-containing protein [Pirellulales bacterium]